MKDIFLRFSPSLWKGGKINTYPALEQGIFLNLMINAWQKGGQIEINEYVFSRQMGVSIEHLGLILKEFEKAGLIVGWRIKFIDEQLEILKEISDERRRCANVKWDKYKQDAKAMQKDAKAMQSNARAMQTDADKIRQDKIRQEEYKERIHARTCKQESEPSQNSRIKFDFEKGEWAGLIEQDEKDWAITYPACDIGGELDKMNCWIKANPKKGKKKNYAAFINNWLSRTQDRGGTK